MIVKSGDDLRSEQFAMQLIETIDLIFKKRKLKLKLTPYEILSTGQNCGVVEFIPEIFANMKQEEERHMYPSNFLDKNF